MSEDRNVSPDPKPTTAGGPLRAATILPGSREETQATAKAPSSSWTAARTASSKEPRKCFSTRWTMTSVSVSVRKTWPSPRSLSLRDQ